MRRCRRLSNYLRPRPRPSHRPIVHRSSIHELENFVDGQQNSTAESFKSYNSIQYTVSCT